MAELKLGVSFDLVYFRQQLSKLSRIASSEFTAPIKIKFDRRVIDRELNNLQRLIKRRTYRVELNIAGGLSKEAFDRLQDRLDSLSKRQKIEIPISVKNAASGRDISRAIAGIKERIGQNQTIKQGEGKIRVGLSVEPSITNADVANFKKAVKSKFEGISVDVKVKPRSSRGGKSQSQIEADAIAGWQRIQQMGAQRMGGGISDAARREQLRSALSGVNVTKAKDIAKQLEVKGAGKYRAANVSELIDKIVAEASIEAITKYLDPKAVMRNPNRGPLMKVLDTFARGFLMTFMSEEGIRDGLQKMRREAAARKALPGVDWPAQTPFRSFPIGPSSTGRALPPGAIPNALPGTAFGARGFLPTDLGEDLKRILRGAAFAFVDAVKTGVRRVFVMEMGSPALPPSRVRGLLPSSVGRVSSPYGGPGDFVRRRVEEAYRRSALRGASVMAESPQGFALGAGGSGSAGPYRPFANPPGGAIVPYQSPSVPTSATRGAGVGRFFGGMPNLPGQGAVGELGQEFGFAAKQVLLFGSAYKALAFLTSFPSQVMEAVSSLQSFNNTLEAITPSSEEFKASNELILDLVERYNTPIQAARDGFTKLYASMAPAGFSGDQIRDLFTGVSKAAATFGMSADKVDRVNYAFAQMASKGQVMSEELKGQLGDVLPGAMAIFAKAAGFEGTDAISKFSAALESGAYKGEAMVALLNNVGVVMNREFGPGAEGAAKTFQGAINRMQNSMKMLYETFEPVAVGFLNAVVKPFSEGIKVLTDGFNSFFTGARAKSAGGFGIAQELERLRPSFEGLAQNVGKLAQQLLQMAGVGLEVAKVLLQIAGSPFVGYLARVYAIIVPLNIAIGVFRGLLASTALQFIVFNARILTGTSTLTAFRGMMASTGQTAAATAATIRGAFATTGIGLVLVGLGLLIERFSTLSQRMNDVKQKALGAAEAIRAMSATEARTKGYELTSGQRLLGELQRRKPPAFTRQAGPLGPVDLKKMADQVEVSSGEAKKLEDLGIPVKSRLDGSRYISRMDIPAQQQRISGLIGETKYQQEQLKFQEQQQKAPLGLASIPEAAAEGESGAGEKLKEYIANLTRLYQKQKEASILEIEGRLLREEIDEDEAARLEAIENKTWDIKIANEALRKAVADVANEKLSASDKALKIADLEREATTEIGNIQKKYGNEVLKNELKLRKPIEDAIKDTTHEMAKMHIQYEALTDGSRELSAAQKADLDVMELIKDMTPGQIAAMDELIKKYRERRLALHESNKTFDRAGLLRDVQDRIDIARAPLGEERITELMQEGYDRKFAEGINALEEFAQKQERIKQGFNDLEDSIRSSLGTAITDVLTDFTTMEDAVMRLRQSVADAFKQMANMIIQEMMRAAVHWAVKQLFSFIAPNIGGTPPPSPAVVQAANGALWQGGFTPFANGGMVTGPTLGLVGEGRFNEAVVPLPNGKSIPVDLGGNAGNNISTNIVVNMNNNGQTSTDVTGRGGQAFGREIEGAVRSVILKESRPGGLIYSGR